ncbi:TrkA C-terminal domain-containing protein [Humisphaera borealis]|uniref:TrkA C-terminal domain-containing protein n=1 Tax=Humisphaera borealis TaxID=2807512 RepID=A0A7M2WQ54_9BACT|nr:TrkA C-terminal domain-containing protein [Humisphaera borealis]QOV87608.1 TrkA C-terminal domain-containing protein [Humisphaera borealis]
MIAGISLLAIVAVSLFLVRLGKAALVLTGLSPDTADFQAYSAFFGVGFTTSEAEMVVSHPTRRRIIKHLILAGNLGIAASLGSLIVAFVRADSPQQELWLAGTIIGGLILIGVLSSVWPTRQLLDRIIAWSLRRTGALHVADFALLLRVHAGYVVSEIKIGSDSWLINRMLKESLLGSRGVLVLGVTRTEGDKAAEYFGAPTGSFRVRAGDVLTVYGKEQAISMIIASKMPPESFPPIR